MRIKEFLHRSSLHDSYIIGAEYSPLNGTLNMRVVQLISEVSSDTQTEIDVEPTDQVELEILLSGVEHISHDLENFRDYEIYSLDSGMIGPFEIILIQFINIESYKEVYIRGINMTIDLKVLRKIDL